MDFLLGGIPQGENYLPSQLILFEVESDQCDQMLPYVGRFDIERQNHKIRFVDYYYFALAEFLQEGDIKRKRKQSNPV